MRAGGVMLLVGILWQLTGLLLGLSVMLSIFSCIELPAALLGHVILGQILAGIAAVICQLVFWPMVDSTFGQVIIMMPFILLGIPLAAHRRSVFAAMDYHLVFLLLLMPHLPQTATFASASLMAVAVAVVAAPVLTWCCYKVIYPVNLPRRIAHVEAMLLHDLHHLSRPQARPLPASHWQLRLAHRAFRLVRLQTKLQGPQGQAITRMARALPQDRALAAQLGCRACHQVKPKGRGRKVPDPPWIILPKPDSPSKFAATEKPAWSGQRQ